MNAAFDVGADDGFHGILFAFLNPEIKIYAFEPIKNSKRKILKNLSKVENFFNIKIKNYKIINSAVSNFNGKTNFYEAKYKVASSLLKPKRKLNLFWTKSSDLLIKTVSKGIKTKRKYQVNVIALKNFCKKNNITKINYLHIDAQGVDMKVIQSLGEYKKNLFEGVLEISKNEKLNIYQNEKSLKDLKKNFKKWKFKITKIDEVQKNYPSYNIYFRNLSKDMNNERNIFIYPNKRIERMFKRIFLERINLKDFFFIFIWKIKKIFV